MLVGDAPPAALRSPAHIIAALAGGVVAFALFSVVQLLPSAALIILDAAALGLFAVSGAEKAIGLKLNGWVVVLLGAVTAVGGRVVRDLLLSTVPVVLTTNIYATAAAAGAMVTLLATKAKVPPGWAMLAGFIVCVGLRLLGASFDWQLPRVPLAGG